MYLVDTDVMIDIQRGYGPALTWFASLSDLPSIPGFVVMKLIQDAQNKQQVRKVLQLVAPLAIVWPTETDCARALSDFTAYHLSHKVGLIDALIAACAVGRNSTLCTFNVKHYQVISGLSMEQPYSR
ncbi:VapC toxin family PIN domain ribonuclease [Nodosilinea sp. LEGE 06152]|uniref:PIN domain-containing protein n=1 Tax=Nodosilinea sp. LEGE 06152 TaxID=2777966 RepID=UPI00187F338B|nr:PIN domain-containing protein [Nodosilinea sp. LEGE 06152]MBE9155810.1 VapC toxin family PIN domain ribonuclease [Nodosilinea sp. LEGE 06152]